MRADYFAAPVEKSRVKKIENKKKICLEKVSLDVCRTLIWNYEG